VRGAKLIEINTEDHILSIKPFDDRSFRYAAMLYNSGGNIRYATGMDGFIPITVVKSRLVSPGHDGNCFAAAIYVKEVNGSAGETADSFAGMIAGSVTGGTAWLRQLSIMPAHRRKGLGSRAVKLVFEYLRQNCQAQEAFVSVVEENTAGLLFWNRLGFEAISSIEKELFESKQKHNVIIMRKTLRYDPAVSL